MDKYKFKDAIDRVYAIDEKEASIGILEEKTVHSVLKFYYGENINNQEIKINRYFADVKVDNTIYEIQTRQFYKLTNKLIQFDRLHYKTYVVYPVNHIKWIKYLNDDFSYSKRTKSPKKDGIYKIIPELYSLRPFLKKYWVSFIICLLEVEEIRFKNTIGKNNTNKIDRFPIDIIDEVTIENPSDLKIFIPSDLEENFTSKDFAKNAKISLSTAQTTLLLLSEFKIIEKIGSKNRCYLYKVI